MKNMPNRFSDEHAKLIIVFRLGPGGSIVNTFIYLICLLVVICFDCCRYGAFLAHFLHLSGHSMDYLALGTCTISIV